uniref:WD repeat-containing protein 55 homolog n=1 Tax=Strigamia maritima TaxID=126957 RepID=T1JBR5_STRMM
MSLIRQVSLLTAGAQPWNYSVCSAHGKMFAYAATQALYIYEFDSVYNEFKLHSIMAEHNKPISAIHWHPTNHDVLASSNNDNCIMVWHVSKRKLLAVLETHRNPPTLLSWCFDDKDTLAYIDGRGPMFTWCYTNTSNQPIGAKDWTQFNWIATVMKWHPIISGKVVFGHSNGSLSLLKDAGKVLRHNSLDVSSNVDEENPVIAIEWDPLSHDYLLVVHKTTGIRLVDSTSMSVVTIFVAPMSIKTVGWLSDSPGLFVSGDTQSGVLRLWNVSRPNPIENMKLKSIGFHVMLPITSNYSSCCKAFANLKLTASSSTNLLMKAVTPTLIICLFMDGGIGVYNIAHRKWEFLKEMGHIETIFDCKFKPDNSDLFATGSFDGTIKVWNINTMTPEYSSIGNESIIYAISWAPADLNCIAAATSRNGIIIWNVQKCSVIKRIMDHGGDHCAYCVAWNQIDARRIASGSADLTCMVHTADGSLIHKFIHPGIVFGCDWKTDDGDILATACMDGNIRLFNVSRASKNIVKTLQGHTAKVFQVKWNSLRTEILCSSSDDHSIRVWDSITSSCLTVLRGHTNNVRGLVWNPEVPFLLFSGSWDKTIRAWDSRDGACIDVAYDHGADVYGLTIHSSKPFILVSSSRDSTVRVWSTISLCPLLPLYTITQKTWHDIMAFSDRAYSLGAPFLLCGKKSLELKTLINRNEETKYPSTLHLFSIFYSHSWGVVNLWDLVFVIQGKSITQLSPNYVKGIMHAKHITKVKASEAQELEMTTSARFGQGGIGLPSREECLRNAADILLRVGHLQRYCELLAQLGEWEQALAVAPGVSFDYWRELANRRLDNLITANSEKSLVYGVATGELIKVLEFSLLRRDMQDAFLLAAAGSDGKIVKSTASGSQYTTSGTSDRSGIDSTAVSSAVSETRGSVKSSLRDSGVDSAGSSAAPGTSGRGTQLKIDSATPQPSVVSPVACITLESPVSGAVAPKSAPFLAEMAQSAPSPTITSITAPIAASAPIAPSGPSTPIAPIAPSALSAPIAPIVPSALSASIAAFAPSAPNNTLPTSKTSVFLPKEAHKYEYLNEVTKVIAEWHYVHGSPVHAACCRLSVDEIEDAIVYLIRGQELELAVSVGLVLNVKPEVVNIALNYLAKRCERLGQWDLAIKLLQLLPGNYETSTWQTCSRCTTSASELEGIYKLANLLPRDRCVSRAQELLNGGNTIQALRYYLVSPDVETGIQLGLDFVKGIMSSSIWQVVEVWKLLQLLTSVKTERLQEGKNNMLLSDLLILSAYIGALMAIRKHYYPIVAPMWNHACVLMKSYPKSTFPFQRKRLMMELNAWRNQQKIAEIKLEKLLSPPPSQHHVGNGDATSVCESGSELKENELTGSESAMDDSELEEITTLEEKQLLKDVLARVGEETGKSDIGPTIVTGSHLPSHSDTHLCCLTGEIIQGPAYFLEDGVSAMSINDVLMWAKVNPFSPLGTGMRLNPF